MSFAFTILKTNKLDLRMYKGFVERDFNQQKLICNIMSYLVRDEHSP